MGLIFLPGTPHLKVNHAKPKYFESLTFPQIRKAFTELRFGQMASAYLEERYKGIPVEKRKCVLGCNQTEDLTHYLLFCTVYKNPRERFLAPIIQMYLNCTTTETVVGLLADTQLYITYAVAQFALAAKKLRF